MNFFFSPPSQDSLFLTLKLESTRPPTYHQLPASDSYRKWLLPFSSPLCRSDLHITAPLLNFVRKKFLALNGLVLSRFESCDRFGQSNVNPSIKINPCVMDEEAFNIVLNINSRCHKLCNSLLVASAAIPWKTIDDALKN